MIRSAGWWLAISGLVVGGAGAAGAQQQCEAGGPVSIVVVASPERVQRYAADLPGTTVLRRDAETVVLADGRVVTADIAAVGPHLNALGWAGRPIQIVGSFSRRSARASAPG